MATPKSKSTTPDIKPEKKPATRKKSVASVTTTKATSSSPTTPKPKAAKATKAPTKKPTGNRKQTATTALSKKALSEAIAIRAYYLGENRQRLGIPSDPTQDWLDAEEQVRRENEGSL